MDNELGPVVKEIDELLADMREKNDELQLQPQIAPPTTQPIFATAIIQPNGQIQLVNDDGQVWIFRCHQA